MEQETKPKIIFSHEVLEFAQRDGKSPVWVLYRKDEWYKNHLEDPKAIADLQEFIQKGGKLYKPEHKISLKLHELHGHLSDYYLAEPTCAEGGPVTIVPHKENGARFKSFAEPVGFLSPCPLGAMAGTCDDSGCRTQGGSCVYAGGTCNCRFQVEDGNGGGNEGGDDQGGDHQGGGHGHGSHSP